MARSLWKPTIDLINYHKNNIVNVKTLLSNIRRFWILKINVGNKVEISHLKNRTRVVKIRQSMVGMKLGQLMLTKKKVIHRCRKKKKKK